MIPIKDGRARGLEDVTGNVCTCRSCDKIRTNMRNSRKRKESDIMQIKTKRQNFLTGVKDSKKRNGAPRK